MKRPSPATEVHSAGEFWVYRLSCTAHLPRPEPDLPLCSLTVKIALRTFESNSRSFEKRLGRNRTDDGRAFRMLTIIDEYILGSVWHCWLTDVSLLRMSWVSYFASWCSGGIPEHIRSDNGPEFTARAIRAWLDRLGVKTLFIGGVLGRMVTLSHSMASSGMNYSIGRYSPRWPKHGSWSSIGGGNTNTMRSGGTVPSANGLLHLRPSWCRDKLNKWYH